MEVQIMSDLHLEAPKGYDIFEITPKASYLALLGDIGTVASHKAELQAFLVRQLKQFRAVLFVPGNHEAYDSTWPETLRILRDFEIAVPNDASLGEFVLLDGASFKPPGSNTMILGCSLFSSVPAIHEDVVSTRLNDFYRTGRDWTVASHNAAHLRDLSWLNTQVEQLEQDDDVEKIIIMTHWSPTTDPRAVEPRHAGTPVTTAFSTDLSREPCFRSPKVRVWAFGHTHWNCDFLLDREGGAGPLRLVTNQRGYYFAQAELYDGAKTIEL